MTSLYILHVTDRISTGNYRMANAIANTIGLDTAAGDFNDWPCMNTAKVYECAAINHWKAGVISSKELDNILSLVIPYLGE